LNFNGIPQVATFSLPCSVPSSMLVSMLHVWLNAKWVGRETVSFAVSRKFIDIKVGDLIALPWQTDERGWKVERVETSEKMKVFARATEAEPTLPMKARSETTQSSQTFAKTSPLVHFLDLPVLSDSSGETGNRIAAAVEPWAGTMAVYSSPGTQAFSYRQALTSPATIGELLDPLESSTVTSRWYRAKKIQIRFHSNAVFSLDKLNLLGGGNALAVRSNTDQWELIQFLKAEPIEDGIWEISELLRGQRGTEAEARAGASIGADVVLIDAAVPTLQHLDTELGLPLNWSVGPVGRVLGDSGFTTQSYAPGYRGLLPFSVVHLSAHQSATGNLSANWIRRDRLWRDDWQLLDIPMSESELKYTVLISNHSGVQLSREVLTENVEFDSSELMSIFGAGQHTVTIEVAQISTSMGPGPFNHYDLQLIL